MNTTGAWEHFRDIRLQALKAALANLPPRSPLNTQLVSEFNGEGYRRQNVVYQSQPGFWVTANLYLPERISGQAPGIIVLHSLQGPKAQFELQDMGITWARAGCVVLVPDQIGYGDRIETYPWDRDNYNARYVLGEQLYLAGSSLMTWMVWDAMRGIDLLCDRPDVNWEGDHPFGCGGRRRRSGRSNCGLGRPSGRRGPLQFR